MCNSTSTTGISSYIVTIHVSFIAIISAFLDLREDPSDKDAVSRMFQDAKA